MGIIKTRAQHVADNLRERILGGEFKGGSKLRQDAIAQDYGVSRIPVREALLALEAEGLVEFHPHRGAFTTELSAETIRELFELRVLLEVKAFEQSIPNLTTADLEHAARLLSRYDEALDSGRNIDGWSEFNSAFHTALYKAAKMPATLALIGQLNTKCDRYVRMQLLYSQEIKKAELEHQQLLALARSGKTKKAGQLLELHIRGACDSILAVFERSRLQEYAH
jgi:DNA-binding GntR family transcriptional regulator